MEDKPTEFSCRPAFPCLSEEVQQEMMCGRNAIKEIRNAATVHKHLFS